MRQVTYKTNDALIHVSGKLASGLLELGVPLGLQTTTHTAFTSQVNDFIAADSAHRQAREQLALLRSTAAMSGDNVRNFLRLTRDVMKPVLGYNYSPVWIALGFDQTLVVPKGAAKYVPMMQRVQTYLVDNPTKEITAMNVTAAQATALSTAYNTAQQAHAAQKLVFRTSGKTRNTLGNALRGKVRLLIAELTNVLPAIDPRWERFGLNQPGSEQTPPQPGKIATTMITSNKVALKWDPVARARHYRVWIRVDGIDTEPRDLGTTDTPNFVIEDLPAASKIEITVSAVNSGGESVRSEVAVVNTP